MGTFNQPIRFAGTDEQRAANRATHWFVDGRCADCDCRPTGAHAEYPCGAEAPRETLTFETDEQLIAHARASMARLIPWVPEYAGRGAEAQNLGPDPDPPEDCPICGERNARPAHLCQPGRSI